MFNCTCTCTPVPVSVERNCLSRANSSISKTGKKRDQPLPNQYEFSADLWKAVRATNPSAELVSPVGFGILMTIVKVGARGPAADEIAQTLQFNSNAAIVQKYFKILKSLEGWKVDGIFLTIFTVLCGPADTGFHEDFVEFAEDKMRAEVRTVNYGKQPQASKELNERFATSTKNIITSVIKPADIGPKMKLILLSGVCFKGLYKNSYRFKAQQTKREQFFNANGTVVDVDMMSGTSDYIFGRLDDLQSAAISIPYEGGNYSLTLVLPDSKTGLPELEKAMDENFFANVRAKVKYSSRVFTAKIPKFKVNCRVDLVAVLKSMGIKSMFDAKADFQGYFQDNGKGHYSRVFQQCALEVSEKGSEGGPAPAGVKLQSGDTKFEANHPFLFFITDEKNDAVVLMGCKTQF
ncbi:unnamed protein product [Allacma fusca]|uniref:Serpin domain-containing protein n=1 Tax=Allacma fusca TaxID=39272 RepID=A0A8J2KJP5_9HEXA|nr:unnamed protein product [Allacma fusca]